MYYKLLYGNVGLLIQRFSTPSIDDIWGHGFKDIGQNIK